MAVTPRSRTASANASPSESNGRKQPAKVAIDFSDEDDSAGTPSRKTGKAKAKANPKEPIEIADDDDDDEDGDEDDDAEGGGEEEYEIEVVRGHRQKKGKEAYNMEYLIKWKGYPDTDNTWEPEAQLPQDLVNAYWKKQPSKSQPKKFEKRMLQESEDQESEDDIEPIEADSDDDQYVKQSKRGSAAKAKLSVSPKRNGRASSTTGSKRSSPSKSASGSARGAKKRRTSSSGRGRRAPSSDDDQYSEADEEDEEQSEEDDQSVLEQEQTALNSIRTKFLKHFVENVEDWEDEVESVINMQRSSDDDELRSHLQFRNTNAWRKAMGKMSFGHKYSGKGPQIWVANETANERCPQKVIKFYESHLRFADTHRAAP